MIRLTEIVAQYMYMGDCISGLDDETFRQVVANDATEMAGIIDNSINISKAQFVKFTGKYNEVADEFGYNKENDIVWSYDITRDLHKFYVR